MGLVIKKFRKGLENSLKGTSLNPCYQSQDENGCFASFAAGTLRIYTWSEIKWISVNIFSDYAEIMEIE